MAGVEREVGRVHAMVVDHRGAAAAGPAGVGQPRLALQRADDGIAGVDDPPSGGYLKTTGRVRRRAEAVEACRRWPLVGLSTRFGIDR